MVELRRMSADAARRTALAAQGLARPRPTGRITRQHLRRVLDHVGLIQIDSVNVLVRSQELPLFSRLGPHPRRLLPDAAADGEVFECWAHAACLVPSRHHHLHRWRMQKQSEIWYQTLVERRPQLIEDMLRQVSERGPLAIGDIEGRVRNRGGQWWDWDEAKQALEYLFASGRLGVLRRPRDFARLYDLPERILPPEVLAAPTPDETEARVELILLAARSLGVATLGDLADYHPQKLPTVREIVADLVDAGRLVPVEVDGWAKPAFLHPDASTPRSVTGRTVLSPFDSLIWTRERTERVFGFTYRLEIYTPAPKRVYGYYVLPFLLDGHLVGRVDLKADRAAGVLRAQASHVEPDLDNPLDRPDVAAALYEELGDLARWLELPIVGAVDRGNLAPDLIAAGAEPLG